MVLFSALLKTQDMTLKVLLNSFMPHYPPIYKMSRQSVLAFPWAAQGLLICFCTFGLCQEEVHRMAIIILGDSRSDKGKLKFH